MKPGPYHHLAAMVRKKREKTMTNAEQSRRLSEFLKDQHTATLRSVQIHGWWELYDLEEMRAAVLGELAELKTAFDLRNIDGPHGVIQEALDTIVVLSKTILRLTDMLEKGETP